jgi:plasmid stability protein
MEGDQGQGTEKFVVRLPLGMRRLIALAAAAHRRSMNSEIVAILEHSLGNDAEDGDAGDEPAAGQVTAVLTPQEMELLRRLRHLTESQRRALLQLLG